jgi:hypothetical protein
MPLKTNVTIESIKDRTDAELVSIASQINAFRTCDDEADILDEIGAEQKRRRDAADSKRLAKLLDLLAEYVMHEVPTGALTFGEGINAHEVDHDDLYRAAELLDPTINE